MILMGGGRGYRPGGGIDFTMFLITVVLYFLSGIPQKLYALADPPAGMFAAWVPVMIVSFVITKFISKPVYKLLANTIGEKTAKTADFIIWIISAVVMFVLFFAAVRKGNPFTTTYMF